MFVVGSLIRRKLIDQEGLWKTFCRKGLRGVDEVVTIKTISGSIITLEEVEFTWTTTYFDLVLSKPKPLEDWL